MADESERLLTPAEAAEALGVSSAMARRHAAAYEAVYGPLPRANGRARAFPREALDRIHVAQRAYHDGAAPSVEHALRQDATGESFPAVRAVPERVRPSDLETILRPLLDELQALRDESRRRDEQIETLLAEVRELRALPGKKKRPLWVRVADFFMGRPEAL